MPTKPTVTVSTTGSQRANRYTDTFYDQHRSPRFPLGRPWCGERELAANKGDADGFCSLLSPGDHLDPTFASVWEAPWYPEQRPEFWKFNYQRRTISIDYGAMIAHDQHYLNLYHDAAALISMEKGLPVVEDGKVPPYMITKILGLPPRSPKIAQAAQAGDLWLLGFTLEPNRELERLIAQLTGNYKPILEPQAVVNAEGSDVQQMIADAVAMALRLRDEEQKAKMNAKMEKARAGKRKSTPAETGM